MSQAECDPNQTTQFSVSGPAGTGIKIISRSMLTLVAILALVAVSVNGILTWQLIKTIDALTVALNARAAESLSRQNDVAVALRELACVQALPEPERGKCKTIARM